MWLVVACVVLGLGGIVVDHFVGTPGAASVANPTAGTNPPSLSQPLPGPSVGSISASVAAMMGLQPVKARPAPPIALRSQAGKEVALSSFAGKVVVVSFFNGPCNDICHVLEQELAGAATRLASHHDGQKVEFLTVNSDPVATSMAAAAPALAGPLATQANWDFLTGSIAQLDPVWKAYGITIDVVEKTKAVSHDNLLWFVGPSGRLQAQATPTANQVGQGRYTLSTRDVGRFAAGVASEVEHLLARGRS